MLADFSLTGRVAVVTGGTRGIGRAIAQGLGEAGAKVFVTARSPEGVDETVRFLASQGVQADGEKWDVADTDRATEVVDHVVGTWGRLDILVNNAGIIRRNPAEDFAIEDWRAVLDTNVSGAFALSQAAGRRMIAQRHGRIVNIASVLSFSGGSNVVAYAAAKGALVQLTKSLSAEWSRHGVTTNAIAAGYISTDFTEALRRDEERSEALLRRIPAGRWGEPEDLVGATVFLASDAARYVTGAVLAVDGGWLAS